MNGEYFIKRHTWNINQNPLPTSSTRDFLIFDIGVTLLPISVIRFPIYKAFSISFSISTTRLYFFNQKSSISIRVNAPFLTCRPCQSQFAPLD